MQFCILEITIFEKSYVFFKDVFTFLGIGFSHSILKRLGVFQESRMRRVMCER